MNFLVGCCELVWSMMNDFLVPFFAVGLGSGRVGSFPVICVSEITSYTLDSWFFCIFLKKFHAFDTCHLE